MIFILCNLKLDYDSGIKCNLLFFFKSCTILAVQFLNLFFFSKALYI